MMNKTPRILTLLCCLAIICVGPIAFARKPDYPKAPPYYPLPSGHFPLRASSTFYAPYLNEQQVKWLKEAGFNGMGQYLTYAELDTLLKYAEKYDLYAAVSLSDLRDTTKIAGIVDRYGNHPRTWLFTVWDEPHTSKFQQVKQICDKLRETGNPKPGLVNIFPAVSEKQCGAPDYRTYVEEYVRTVNPAFISYDAYPIRMDKNGNITVWDDYFYTLEVVSDVAKKSGRPFWGYVLCNKHWSYPKPTPAYLSYQIFTNLAYGAQSLGYFTYTLPDYDKTGEYSDAPIDKDGNRTDVWYFVRDLNREITNLEKVFLGAEVEDVSHTGRLTHGTKRLGKLPKPFRGIETHGEGVVVSRLKNDGRRYLVLVNKDVTGPQEVRVALSNEVKRLYGDGSEASFTGGTITLTPGGYAIFKYGGK